MLNHSMIEIPDNLPENTTGNSGATRNTFLLLTLLLTIVFTAGWVLLRPGAERAFDLREVLLQNPRVVDPFQLYRADNADTFSHTDLRGQWSLVYSGFTRCPDLCPTTLAVLSRVRSQQILPLQIVFITVDPAHDADNVLQRYTAHFAADIVPLRGADPQIRNALAALSFFAPQEALTTDTVAHSGAVALVDPQGYLRGLFRYPQSEAQMSLVLRHLRSSTPDPSPAEWNKELSL